MKPIAAALLAAALSFAPPSQASAIDRSLGADVPKPSASGDAWTDAEITALVTDIDGMLAGSATLQHAHVGLLAVDARDGHVLYEHNAGDAFQPASTLKLVTASAALDTLGPAFRFRTQAATESVIDKGFLHNSLWLYGTGDVLLDQTAFATLPAAVRAAKIKQIEYDVLPDPDDVPVYPPGWAVDDMPWSYAAPVAALGFADDEVDLTIRPGARAGAPVVTSLAPAGTTAGNTQVCVPELGMCVVVTATTGAKGSASTLDARVSLNGPYEIDVTGRIAFGAPPESLSLAALHPPFFAAAAAHRALVNSGIAVLRQQPVPTLRTVDYSAPRKVIWTHDSEALGDLVADTWIPSDNLLAESLLHALGARPPALRGTAEAGIAAEKLWLAKLGIDSSTVAIEDGSGLSAYDRMTPRDVVTVLRHDWDGPYHNVVLDALPISGVRGTLRSAFTGTPAERRVFAKTGTVTNASALAGYIATARHGAVIFAFDVDDWVGAAADLRELRGRVLSRIVGN